MKDSSNNVVVTVTDLAAFYGITFDVLCGVVIVYSALMLVLLLSKMVSVGTDKGADNSGFICWGIVTLNTLGACSLVLLALDAVIFAPLFDSSFLVALLSSKL